MTRLTQGQLHYSFGGLNDSRIRAKLTPWMSDIMYCSTPLTLTPTEGQGAGGDAAVMGPRMGHRDSGTIMGMCCTEQEHYRFRSVFWLCVPLLRLHVVGRVLQAVGLTLPLVGTPSQSVPPPVGGPLIGSGSRCVVCVLHDLWTPVVLAAVS